VTVIGTLLDQSLLKAPTFNEYEPGGRLAGTVKVRVFPFDVRPTMSVLVAELNISTALSVGVKPEPVIEDGAPATAAIICLENLVR
jgi:hypothetical protein